VGIGLSYNRAVSGVRYWKNKWRGPDSNRRPRGYEPRELPGCSTPRQTRNSRTKSPSRQGRFSETSAGLPFLPDCPVCASGGLADWQSRKNWLPPGPQRDAPPGRITHGAGIGRRWLKNLPPCKGPPRRSNWTPRGPRSRCGASVPSWRSPSTSRPWGAPSWGLRRTTGGEWQPKIKLSELAAIGQRREPELQRVEGQT
jgi:hypothetical protein